LTSSDVSFYESVTLGWKQRQNKWQHRNDPPPPIDAVFAGVLRRISKPCADLLRAARLLGWDGSWWEACRVQISAPALVCKQFAENVRLRREVESAFVKVLGYSGPCFLECEPLAPPVLLPTLSQEKAKDVLVKVMGMVDRPIAALLRSVRKISVVGENVRLQSNGFVCEQFSQGNDGIQRRAQVEAAFTHVLGYQCNLRFDLLFSSYRPPVVPMDSLLATALDLGGVIVTETELQSSSSSLNPDLDVQSMEKQQTVSDFSPPVHEPPSLLNTALDLGGEIVDS
jgi:hypothetical protein